jgi:N-acetylmuramoyl-L-alanine amidase
MGVKMKFRAHQLKGLLSPDFQMTLLEMAYLQNERELEVIQSSQGVEKILQTLKVFL